MGVNSVTLVGRAGRDPEVRYFESGSVVANLTIAVNRRSRDDEPDWFNLEIWGKQAQVAAAVSNWTVGPTETPEKSAANRSFALTGSSCSAPNATARLPQAVSVAIRPPTRKFPSDQI